MQIELEGWEQGIIRAACRVFAGKCLVEGDMVLYSLSVTVARNPKRVKELIDLSLRFRAELLRQKDYYERMSLK